jgi:hypothetical protein
MKSALKKAGQQMGTLGHGPHHGQAPTDAATNPATLSYFAIIYMQLKTDPTTNVADWIVKHSYFKIGNLNAVQVDAAVAAIVKERFVGNNWGLVASNPRLPLPYRDPTNLHRDYYEGFGNGLYFSAPLKIYIVIDNPNIRFDSTWPLMFTKFGADSRGVKNENDWGRLSKSMKPNKTFYGAKVGGFGGNMGSNILYFENHMKDGNGNNHSLPPTVPDEYSFNLNIWMKARVGAEIPMIIDPDTGNGTGAPPPVRG